MARSVVYDHILAIVCTECNRFAPGSIVRLLDAGCGTGTLIEYLRERMPELHPQLQFQLFGFDVCDYGTRRNTEPPPGISWISINDAWPYPDGFFQVVISNHVLEHVATPHVF